MVPSNFNSPSSLRGDREAWLDTTVHPSTNVSQLDAASGRKAEYRGMFAPHKLLNAEPRAGFGVVDKRARYQTLSNPRPCSDDDQIRLLETTSFRIEVVEAARHARDDRLVLVDLFDLVPGGLEDVLEGDEVLRDATFGDVEGDSLGGIEGLGCGRGLVEAQCGDAATGADQLALGGRFLDQVPVVLDIRRRPHSALELGQERLPTNPLEHPHLLQLRCQRQQVDRIRAVVEVQRRAVNLSMMIQIEIIGTEEIGHPDDRVAVEHQRTEYRRLGFKVVRRHAAAGRRWSRRASQVNRQAEVTISGILAVTSRWSFTCALPGPIALTGSSNSIFRRSSVMPCCCLSADATSALVTAPNSMPSFPLRSFKVTWAASRRTARALASDSSRCSRWTAVAFCRSTCSCAPRVAGWASLRGIRKFRAKPSATSLVSPALPVPLTSSMRTTFMSPSPAGRARPQARGRAGHRAASANPRGSAAGPGRTRWFRAQSAPGARQPRPSVPSRRTSARRAP